jgi:MOSC domain-containing protein YiiM
MIDRQPRQEHPMTIERIYIAAGPGEPQQEAQQVRVVAGQGVEGDRNFGLQHDAGRNITLVEAEQIESFLREQGRAHDLSVTRRNLVIRGVRLNELVGREFMVGAVRLRGVELCEPCDGLGNALAGAQQSAAMVIKCLAHRAGLRADLLSSGVIERGAPVQVAVQAEPSERAQSSM